MCSLPGARQACVAFGGYLRVEWFLESNGPDKLWWTLPTRVGDQFFYDPTNGTLSRGQLVLSDRGWISPNVSGMGGVVAAMGVQF